MIKFFRVILVLSFVCGMLHAAVTETYVRNFAYESSPLSYAGMPNSSYWQNTHDLVCSTVPDANNMIYPLFSGPPENVTCTVGSGGVVYDSGYVVGTSPQINDTVHLTGVDWCFLYPDGSVRSDNSALLNKYTGNTSVPSTNISFYNSNPLFPKIQVYFRGNGGRRQILMPTGAGPFYSYYYTMKYDLSCTFTGTVKAASISLNTDSYGPAGRTDIPLGGYHNFLSVSGSSGLPDSVANGTVRTLPTQSVNGHSILQFSVAPAGVLQQESEGYFRAIGTGTCDVTVTCDDVTKVVHMTVPQAVGFTPGVVYVNAPSSVVDIASRVVSPTSTPTTMQISSVVGGSVSPLMMTWGAANWGKLTIDTNGWVTGSFAVTVNDSAGKSSGPKRMQWIVIKDPVGPQGDPISQVCPRCRRHHNSSLCQLPAESQESADPIRYANGEMTMYEDDLELGGNMPYFVRSYSNLASQVDGLLGRAWLVNCAPFVYANQGYRCVVLNANSQIAFVENAGIFTPLYTVKSTLRTAGTDLLYTDVSGTRLLFHGLATTPAARVGKIKRMYTPAGLRFDYLYTAAGVLSSIVRAVSATTTDEVRLDVDGSGRINHARHVMVTNGELTTIRWVSYLYYGGSAGEFGDEGFLKAVTVKDGLGATIRQFYYRYYREGEANGFAGGLRVAVGPRNYARMAANYKDPMTLTSTDTDALIQPYIDKAFRYDTAGRVTRQDLQTADVDGSGTYTYAYAARAGAATPNSWLMRTTETCPDGSVNIVYTNKAGDILVKARKASAAATQQWIDAYNYDSSTWALKWHFTPAAVTGFAESNADLIGFNDTVTPPTSPYVQTSTGLIESWDYVQSGAGIGYPSTESERIGLNGTKILRKTMTYSEHTTP